MTHPVELPSDVDGPEELAERVVHAAEELAETLDEVLDEQTRHELVKRMGHALEHTGVQVVDLRDSHTGEIFGLNPDALGDKKGVSGRTRAEVLAARALNQMLRRTRRRRL